ncbi:MAG: SDR family NAD(P)-dependent oxidoreductase, partial [Spirochaetaceae bacterium]
PVQMDVSSRESVQRAAREIGRHTDTLDLLINNAGIAMPPGEQRIEDISEADMRSLFEVNTLGPLRVSQELFGLLRASSNPKIVMISSNAGSIAGQGGGRGVPYCVSKAALNMLTRLLWFHCAAEGVAIAAIHPGWVATDMGGKEGSLSVEESVSRMMELIAALSTDSALYVDYTGKQMPW